MVVTQWKAAQFHSYECENQLKAPTTRAFFAFAKIHRIHELWALETDNQQKIETLACLKQAIKYISWDVICFRFSTKTFKTFCFLCSSPFSLYTFFSSTSNWFNQKRNKKKINRKYRNSWHFSEFETFEITNWEKGSLYRTVLYNA